MASRAVRRLAHRFLLWAVIGLGTFVVGYLAYSTWHVYQKMRIAHAERVYAEAEHDRLQKRTVELTSSIEQLATPRGIEQEIRARYPLVKAGEVEFVLVHDAQEIDTTPAARESVWGAVKFWFGL